MHCCHTYNTKLYHSCKLNFFQYEDFRNGANPWLYFKTYFDYLTMKKYKIFHFDQANEKSQ